MSRFRPSASARCRSLARSQRPLADVGGRLFGMAGRCGHFAGRADLCDGDDECHHACRTAAAVCHGRAGATASDRFGHTQRFHTPHVAILFSAVGMLVLTLSGTFASAATLEHDHPADDLCGHVCRAAGSAAQEWPQTSTVRRARWRDRLRGRADSDRVVVLE